MNKLIYIFMIFFNMAAFAQDTVVEMPEVAIEQPIVKGKKWNPEDIKVDSNDSIQPRKLPAKFKSKYQSEDFVYEEKRKEKNAFDRFVGWLARIISGLFGAGSKATLGVLEIIFRVVAVIIILIVIFLIVKAILNKDGRWIFGRNSDKKIIRYDDIEKNLQLVDFEKLIRETLQSGEMRLSIRYYYLWLLKQLSEKEIIEWDVEKTNSDYLYEIKNEKLKHNFGYLSHLYNYIWYGEFEIDAKTFEKAKTVFEKTIKSV